MVRWDQGGGGQRCGKDTGHSLQNYLLIKIRDRATERQRDREIERQRDRERERDRERQRETERDRER